MGRFWQTANQFSSSISRVPSQGANFVVPHKPSIRYGISDIWSGVALIPTHKPGLQTKNLIRTILNSTPNVRIIVIDDCSPLEYPGRADVYPYFESLAKSDTITLLRTPENKLKAGALNFGLDYVHTNYPRVDIIFTLDDDVAIAYDTLGALAEELIANPKLGAVCSQARVLNKDVNLLTRLQGLEYNMYNTIRTADAGFFKGPLVMHGMLTGYRNTAIQQTGGFAIGHLIEDYEMTVRLKKAGWHVKFAAKARAWTEVPETFNQLWRQRVRWSYGGIDLVSKERMYSAIIQDVIGHIFFIMTFACIIAILTLPIRNNAPEYVLAIIVATYFNVSLSYLFSLFVLKTYSERDLKDVLIRLAIIPEFIYANILSLVVMGSYLFFIYNATLKKLLMLREQTHIIDAYIAKSFNSIGYSQRWGTK